DLPRSLAFCPCGSLYLRDPGSFALCLLGRFALDLAGGFTLRLLRRLALRAFGSLDLRFLSGFALCLPRRLVALRLLGSFTLRSLDGFEPRLLCRLALRLLRGFAPGFLRGGTPCSLGCGCATRGLSPGLFSKRVELCGPVVCLLDRSRTVGGIALCLLCSGLELRHLLPCRICVRTTLLRGEVGVFRCSSLQRRNADNNLPPLGRRCSPALLGLLDIQFGFRFRLRLRFFWHGGPPSKWIDYMCPKTCMARTGPAMTCCKDRYQPRAASASQVRLRSTRLYSATSRPA